MKYSDYRYCPLRLYLENPLLVALVASSQYCFMGAYIIMLLVRCIKATERLWLKQTCNIANLYIACGLLHRLFPWKENSFFHFRIPSPGKFKITCIHNSHSKTNKTTKKGLLYCPPSPPGIHNYQSDLLDNFIDPCNVKLWFIL